MFKAAGKHGHVAIRLVRDLALTACSFVGLRLALPQKQTRLNEHENDHSEVHPLSLANLSTHILWSPLKVHAERNPRGESQPEDATMDPLKDALRLIVLAVEQQYLCQADEASQVSQSERDVEPFANRYATFVSLNAKDQVAGTARSVTLRRQREH